MSDQVPPGAADGGDGTVDPRLLTWDESVSTQDVVDLGDWLHVEDGGSARSPSIANSMSTSSGFSSYAGSVPESPNDVDFSSPGMEPHSLVVSQNPTGLGDAPGDTMHDMAATGQHGAFQAMPVVNSMATNELAALQASYINTLNQMQFDMSQVQDFNPNTIHSIPNPPASMMHCNVPSSET